MLEDKGNTNVVENILKENLSSNVHIDNAFMESFRSELNIKAISKISTLEKVKVGKEQGFFSKIFANRYLKFGFITLALVTLVGATYVLFSGSKGVMKNVKDPNSKLVAQLYVNSGKVNVFRNGNNLSFESDAELLAGDRVTVSDNAIADIKTYYGRLAMDSNSEVSFDEKDGGLYASINNGNVFVSLGSGFSDITLGTPNAQVLISSGSVLVSQNGYLSSTTLRGGLLSMAYASEGDGSTKIACFSGKSTITTGNNQYQVEAGKEVTVTANKTVSAPAELDKTVISPKLAAKVVSNPDKGDVGSMADMVAPVVTVVSPVEGAVVASSSVDVKFSSNEAGYYNPGDGWIALQANQEVTFSKALVNGANVIEFTVKDASYNKRVVSINVTAQLPASFTMGWVADPQPLASGVHLDWSASNAKAGQTYKVFRNGAFYVAFPVKADTVNGANWTDPNTVNGQKYTYVIALYEGGSELAKNVAKEVVATTTPVASGCSIKLVRGAGSTVNWTVTNCADLGSGFKLVWNTEGSPVYPGSQYNYISDTGARSADVNGDGTLHVRVCIYHPELDTRCTDYSNEIVSAF